eukprot:gene7865-5492_t
MILFFSPIVSYSHFYIVGNTERADRKIIYIYLTISYRFEAVAQMDIISINDEKGEFLFDTNFVIFGMRRVG